MKKKEFLSGVISLTLSMLIIQSSSMAFSVYVSGKAGAQQMGLFHLIMSVYSFAATVAISGIPLAATRLVSELKMGRSGRNILKKCIMLSVFFGGLSLCVLFLFSHQISVHLLKNENASLPLRILALSLPFMATSAAIRGYFTGLQKVACITAGKMTEEFSSMLITIFLMRLFGIKDNACTILTIGITSSSVITFLCDVTMCACLNKKQRSISEHTPLRSVFAISAPVAAGTYMRSGLTAAENLIIPAALTKSGASNALAQYGTIKGMAMPVITFPYVFLQSFISLLVPEISGRRAKQSKKSVNRAAALALKGTLIFGIFVASVLLVFGKKLGFSLYNDFSSGEYITALALLAVPMYVDSVTDGLLKGLNEQVYSLKINIADSLFRLPVIWLLLPHTGIYGYIAVMYISELINLTMSFLRLKKIL